MPGLLADLVLALHLAFVVFAVAGGLLVWRRPRLAWLHLPSVAWGVLVEIAGLTCPLTPLENRLRARAGEPGYASGFVEHHLAPILYPALLTRELQIAIGGALLLLNVALYLALQRRLARRPRVGTPGR